jgi:hypothetical protein
MEYYQGTGGDYYSLSWASDSLAKQLVSGTALYQPLELTSSLVGGGLTLNWAPAQGVLTWATNVKGPYVDVPGTLVSPYTVSDYIAPERYFRVRY